MGSLNRNHHLEKNQNWIGGIVSGDIDCNECLEYLLDYKDIPINMNKIEEKFQPRYAINWVKLAYQNRNIYKFDITKTNQILDSISDKIGRTQKRDGEKITNTKNFVDFILENKLYDLPTLL